METSSSSCHASLQHWTALERLLHCTHSSILFIRAIPSTGRKMVAVSHRQVAQVHNSFSDFGLVPSASAYQAHHCALAVGIVPSCLSGRFQGGGVRTVFTGERWARHSLSSKVRRFRATATAMAVAVRDPVGSGQESVWDYPRPPALEPVKERIRIVFNGETIADSTNAYRVLETSHPPVYYIPSADVKMEHLARAQGSTFCEWKGTAAWWTLSVGGKTAENVSWSYEDPTETFLPIKGHLAFYAGPMDACYVGEEQAQPQPGKFYGGWITSKIVGPFKGGPGSWGW